MPLLPGTKLGPYEIVAALGAGGMGEVFRARDTRLDRDAAIKILPAAFAADAERVARFQREARTLASLNHTNIAQIYGLEHVDAGYALAMELVPGEDLSRRIARGPVPLDEAAPIARQVAEALEAAHEQGIIHRDLKPANIQVRPDGVVKVLDFGLAKVFDPSGGSSDAGVAVTVTSPAMTEHGLILGTAAYMAPEQARGKPLDRRADVWAFGCVLYEMLSGRRAFPGDTVSDTLAAVLRGEPEWDALPSDTPPVIRRLLRRCLAKDRRQRLGDMSGARLDLDELDGSPAPADASLPSTRAAAPRTRVAAMAASLAAGLLLAGGVAWMAWPEPQRPEPVHFSLEMPAGYTWRGPSGPGVAISRDGRSLAFIAGTGNDRQLLVRSLNAVETRTIADSNNAYAPFFSPNGREIGFFAEGRLWQVPIDGGARIQIAPVHPLLDRGAAWGTDGFIYLGGEAGISRVPASGGDREALTTVDRAAGEIAHRFPRLLPDGRGVLFTSLRSALGDARIGVLDLATRQARLTDMAGYAPQYVRTGHLAFLRGGTLMRAAFDLSRLEVSGMAEPLLAGVAFNEGGAGHFDISDTGVLVYTPLSGFPKTTPVWADREGHITPSGITPDTYADVAMSPNGGRLALVKRDALGSDILIWDISRQAMTPLTSNAVAWNENPVWISDNEIAFGALPKGFASTAYLFRKRTDVAGQAERLMAQDVETVGGGAGQYPGSVSSDGASLFFSQIQTRDDGVRELNLATLEVRAILPEGEWPRISWDGRWLAFVNQGNVWVQSYPNLTEGRWQVSNGGGRAPLWSRDGELFFWSGSSLMAIAPSARAGFAGVRARPLFETAAGTYAARYASVDGTRFLLLRADERPQELPHVFVNWFEAIRK